MNPKNGVLKIVVVLIILMPVLYGILMFVDEDLLNSTSDITPSDAVCRDVNLEKKGINVFDFIIAMNDPLIKSNTTDMFSSSDIQAINAFIVIIAIFTSFFSFRQHEKMYSVIIFGIFISLTHSLIFNIIAFYYSGSWCLQFALDNLFKLMGAGVVSGVLISSFTAFRALLKSLPEHNLTFGEWAVFKVRYHFFEFNFATLHSWIIVAMVTAGIFIVAKWFNH